MTLTLAERPGPVHISLHNRIALQHIETEETQKPSAYDEGAGEYVDLSDIGSFFADKRKPIIVVGLGLEPDRPYAQIQRLAETLGAPVIDTPKSKGALSADHPLFAGTVGLTRTDPVYELLDEADCILALGFDVVELVKPWDYRKPLVWIASWQNNDPPISCDREYVGNIGEILDAFAEPQTKTGADWGVDRVRRFREMQALRALPTPGMNRILPQTFLTSLRQNTCDDIIVTTDVGSHKIFAALQWEARVPNRYFVSNGLSAMGFGLSSAIAAAEITNQPTVCITGDAGPGDGHGRAGITGGETVAAARDCHERLRGST